MRPTLIESIALILFAAAIAHTFSTRVFERRALSSVHHKGLWRLLGEVEIVFGLWATVLFVALVAVEGLPAAVDYIESRNFTEPMFVFAIMVIAATSPILEATAALTLRIGSSLTPNRMHGTYLATLSIIPLLGSFITEPAAMTLAALIIGKYFFSKMPSTRFLYATLAVLFVNVSIGGTLTSFAAPPVLMVAAPWGWDTPFMLQHFGWKATLAVLVNTIGVTVLLRKELSGLAFEHRKSEPEEQSIPPAVTLMNLGFLAAIVGFAHHPPIFLGLLLIFLGIARAYPQYRQAVIVKEPLLVAFFLGGLVVLGGLQDWWLKPLLLSLDTKAVYLGAIGLTALTDNAALTYLGSLVPGLSDTFKYALVAGAVVGGGLTIIANAPNPAGIGILRRYFDEHSVHPGRLAVAALLPTAVAAGVFWFL